MAVEAYHQALMMTNAYNMKAVVRLIQLWLSLAHDADINKMMWNIFRVRYSLLSAFAFAFHLLLLALIVLL